MVFVVFLSQLHSVSCKPGFPQNIRCIVSFGISTTLWSICGTTCRVTGSGQWSWDTTAHQQLLGQLVIKTKGASWWPKDSTYWPFDCEILDSTHSWLLLHSAQFSPQCIQSTVGTEDYFHYQLHCQLFSILTDKLCGL